MAKWQDGVITNAGISLLGEVIAGGEINITRAALGGGTVDEAALMAQTALTLPLTISPVIAAKKLVEGKGIEIRIQIRNDGLAEDKVMKQVGLFAQLNSGDEVLFAIMQNESGEEIPSEASYKDFMLEFTAALAVSNTGSITVSVSGNAVISRDDLDLALSEYTKTIDLPTSLPANGGNADTVDGLHAIDFSQIINYGNTSTDTKTAVGIIGKVTAYWCYSWTDYPTGLPDGQGTILAINYKGSGTAGTDKIWTTQIYISATSSFTNPRIYYRTAKNNSVGDWKDIADGGNAATVGGAAVVTSAALGLHRIASGTDEANKDICPAGCWYGRHS